MGGTIQHKRNRLQALNNLKHESQLTSFQLKRWEAFSTTWDTRMAEEHKANWGKMFVEILHDLWIRTEQNGDKYALSVHMEQELKRVFHEKGPLVMAHESDTEA